MKFSRYCLQAVCLAAVCAQPMRMRAADPAPFNLTGPKINIRVTRNGKTLPIAQVPNLQVGDQLWVKADLPADQSNHLVLVIAFLRGTTNEPPDTWFTEIDTWDKKTQEGTTVYVPIGAQQALLFLAPEAGEDFKSLRSTVKTKPGQFIRADADLVEASFEQQRIERYLAAMKTVSSDNPKAIADRSARLAATLGLKPKQACFKQPVSQQVACLTQSSAPVILDDQQSQSLAEALSNGPGGDLVNQASYTPQAGGGLYSAYVGAVVDVVRLVGTLVHGPDYQYIPGLSFPDGDTLNLKLNAPPSFKKPRTVIVVGLPFVQKDVTPVLKPQQPDEVACLVQPKMPLLVTGAPLVFSTAYAQDMVLHVNRTSGAVDLPLKPDAMAGGLVTEKADGKVPDGADKFVTGTVRGRWGFDTFEGPTLNLQQMDGGSFKVVGGTPIAGKDTKLQLEGDAVGCVQHIVLTDGKDHKQDVSFKPADGSKGKTTLDLSASLKDVKPGDYALMVQQYEKPEAEKVPLTAYNGDVKFEAVTMHAGDSSAEISGSGLKDVASVQIAGQEFTPRAGAKDDKTLQLIGKSGVTPKDGSEATVKLKDGRTMTVKIELQAARPSLKVVSLKAVAVPQAGSLAITLTGKDEIPLQSKVTIVLQSGKPFDHGDKVEVATVKGGAHTELSMANNTLVLQDEHTALATLDPQKAFGDSGFGKLQIRAVSADGTSGDWVPLGTLVRLPQISAIECSGAGAGAETGSGERSCKVEGKGLFLVQSFGAAQNFTKTAEVPTGFSDSTFTVPAPADGKTLYLKLRDDPGAVATVVVSQPAAPAAGVPAAPAAPVAAGPTAAAATPASATPANSSAHAATAAQK